jgi:short-subunit dehydrogenase
MATYLITGAGRGIGAELARQAVAGGHDVFATVRTASGQAPKGVTLISGVDMTKRETISLIAKALDGRCVDVLINNAGVIGPKRQSTLDMDFDGFAETLLINTIAPLAVTQAVLPNLRAARDRAGIARIATISSQMGQLSRLHPARSPTAPRRRR